MLILLSPAKSLDTTTRFDRPDATQPALLEQAETLVKRARRMSAAQLQTMMGVSEAIAQENVDRFKAWTRPFTSDNATPAAFMFTGDVYRGLDATTLDEAGLAWAQDHVRILSGLYGLLRPLDLIQPYRLEMGLSFPVARKKNLYEFWGDVITQEINAAVKASGSTCVVNLASNEYFKAVKPATLTVPVTTPAFRENRDGELKMISFSAKRARGTLTRYIIENQLESPDGLQSFTRDRYRLRRRDSTTERPLFARKFMPAK